jgi:hypothetical protein
LLVIVIVAFTKEKGIIPSDKKEQQGFAVIELFTSEGCSSCPPADDALAEIQKEYKDKNVLLLGFHVDYWDRLGWKDPFSSADFTSRQEYYTGIFDLSSSYTPEAVINGQSEFVGSDKIKIISVIEDALKIKSNASVKLKAIQNSSGKIEVNYSIEGNNSTGDQLVLLLIQKTATNNIKRGENEGKTLHHINIVRKISYLPVTFREEASTFVLPSGLKKEEVFIAAFIQDKKKGNITGMGTVPVN